MTLEEKVDEFFRLGRENIQELLKDSRCPTENMGDRIQLIAKYTAAFHVNFTDWIGKTIPFARHEKTRMALIDNLRCECIDDHIGMLERFAEGCGAFPNSQEHYVVAQDLAEIRGLFGTPHWSGLTGTALIALLEHTSLDFIPELSRAAENLGCSSGNLEYIRVHGEADEEHSRALVEALIAEVTMGYEEHLVEDLLDEVTSAVSGLFDSIFRQQNI